MKPQTIREYLFDYLYQRGMFSDQANQVLETMFADESQSSMRERWDESVALYPSELLVALTVCAKQFALEWIDQNLPRAWYRPVFAN